MSISKFSDVLDDLGVAADLALRNVNGAGDIWCRAVARGNIHVHRDPGARIDVDNALVVGPAIKGRARNSIVVSVGKERGLLDVRDSTVVGPNVRVRARGRTTVHGRNAVVRIKGSRDQSSVAITGQRKKVKKAIQSTPRAVKNNRPASNRRQRD